MEDCRYGEHKVPFFPEKSAGMYGSTEGPRVGVRAGEFFMILKCAECSRTLQNSSGEGPVLYSICKNCASLLERRIGEEYLVLKTGVRWERAEVGSMKSFFDRKSRSENKSIDRQESWGEGWGRVRLLFFDRKVGPKVGP